MGRRKIILHMPIQSFGDRYTQSFFINKKTIGKFDWSRIENIALRKLDMLNYAKDIKDLRSPPGNRLEALKGDRKGFFSIRINDQWRIIFKWSPLGPTEVEIIDYH